MLFFLLQFIDFVIKTNWSWLTKNESAFQFRYKVIQFNSNVYCQIWMNRQNASFFSFSLYLCAFLFISSFPSIHRFLLLQHTYTHTLFGCNHFLSKYWQFFGFLLKCVDILVVSCEYKINRTLVMHVGISSNIVKERIRKNTHLISWSTSIDYVEGKCLICYSNERALHQLKWQKHTNGRYSVEHNYIEWRRKRNL